MAEMIDQKVGFIGLVLDLLRVTSEVLGDSVNFERVHLENLVKGVWVLSISPNLDIKLKAFDLLKLWAKKVCFGQEMDQGFVWVLERFDETDFEWKKEIKMLLSHYKVGRFSSVKGIFNLIFMI